MSRSEPNDGKAAITTTIEKINALKCDEVATFCNGKSNTNAVKPSEIVDEVTVENLLYGIIQIKTRSDTETKLRNIAFEINRDYPIESGNFTFDIIGAYRRSDAEASTDTDKTNNDEKWRTAILEQFRE